MDISTREQVLTQIQQWQSEGLSVGFTSGVFDLVHVGHLDYLIKAKVHCDRLVVAVNADSSVRKNKGPKRPIVPEVQRAAIIAGLKPVDATFVFNERNNNHNIETLRPDVYIKAGDYDISRLSSAPIIQAYGGRVELIALANATSTSATIESVLSKYVPQHNACPEREARPCIFLDRDGVINTDIGYLHRPEQFTLAPGALEGLKKLSTAGFALVIVTNQAGIGLGYFSHEDFFQVNRAMFRAIAPSGASLDRIFYCPHGVDDDCDCRKPKAGMLERGFKELNLNREASWMVGDMPTDIEAGHLAGVKTAYISETTTEGAEKTKLKVKPTVQVTNLEEAADAILAAME
jgi:rfaE bifunctional protein nucleotidyltransferase chain/domain